MKRMLAALMLLMLLPVCALGEIKMDVESSDGCQLVVFSAQAAVPQTPGKKAPVDPVQMMIGMQIDVRFEQEAAKKAAGRAGAAVMQTGSLYQDGKIASMGLVWQGEQASGREGSCARGLTVSLETGMEIYLDEVLTDYEGAVAAMEAIIERDVLENMSDYMEYADLLPMPTDSYYLNELGLTICYPEDRYRYFDGECGSVTFYWHELADYIGEESPAYALAHPDGSFNPALIENACFDGALSPYMHFELGEALGGVAKAYRLADPDYTTDALVYPLERVRGYAVELPKYAESVEEDTPVSAIRSTSVSVGGLLTTGKTTDVEAMQLLGEPEKTIVYDEDAAQDALLAPGESLLYEIEGRVLQLHFDESSVLACVILRDAMPESLY